MTKENILKVAIDQFSLYGYDAVSMNKLASKLEVNKATIYYHYKDKKSLYQEVVTTLIRKNRGKIEEIIDANIESKEKFRQYISLFIATIKETPQIVPLTLREMANLGVNVVDSIEDDLDQEIKYLSVIVQELNLKEKHKETDPFIIKALIYGTVNSYYSMQMSNVNISTTKEFNKNSDAVLDYTDEFITNILLDALCK
ncbi:MAG: TetR/AcrR family transcriptional regulator [Campylobacterota bacterium]|nr:TetR/AcrR family transcriptional regulator [Campylobacterota bacterium]